MINSNLAQFFLKMTDRKESYRAKFQEELYEIDEDVVGDAGLSFFSE